MMENRTMITMGRIVLLLAVSAMMLGAGGITPAAADVTWNFTGVTTDLGGTVKGSMVYNTLSPGFDNWTVTVHDPSLASAVDPGSPDTFTFTPGGDQYLSTAGGQLFFALPASRPPQPPSHGTLAYTLFLAFKETPNWAIPGKLDIASFSAYTIGVYTPLDFWYAKSDLIRSGTLSSVPLPASLLLLGSGLLGLAGWRRLRKG
jgi:hypothetical protein